MVLLFCRYDSLWEPVSDIFHDKWRTTEDVLPTFSFSVGMSLYIYIYILPYDFIMWFKLQSRYVNVHFCQLSNVFGCMSLVNVTSLRFSQFIFHKFAVFNNCQKHLDDKSHLNCNGFRLQIVKKNIFGP